MEREELVAFKVGRLHLEKTRLFGGTGKKPRS
jgi:hypothetical protein